MYSIPMSIAIKYQIDSTERVVTFREPQAKLPVKLKQQGGQLMLWGRRMRESGHLPFGACALLEHIQAGQWDEYFPKSVIILANAFMERDIEGVTHWHELIRGNYLQGILARHENEYRVYVVTIFPQLPTATYARWPRIVNSSHPIN